MRQGSWWDCLCAVTGSEAVAASDVKIVDTQNGLGPTSLEQPRSMRLPLQVLALTVWSRRWVVDFPIFRHNSDLILAGDHI